MDTYRQGVLEITNNKKQITNKKQIQKINDRNEGPEYTEYRKLTTEN